MSDDLYEVELPLLKWTVGLFNVDFSKTFIIAVQHLLPTTLHLVRALVEKGLEPSNLVLLGKCYSTDPITFDLLAALGVKVCGSSSEFDSHASYDEQFDQKIEKLIEKLYEQDLSIYEKIIVLDDGGHLLTSLQRSNLPKNLKIVGIEQTSAGYWRTNSISFDFPIINLARSPAKLNFETPMIINRVLNIIRKSISVHAFDRSAFLLIGKGFLGERVSQEIKLYHPITVFDCIREKSDISYEELPEQIAKADILVGCTGTTSLSKHYHHCIRKGSVLISTSSSDREFDAVWLRQKVPRTHDCHSDLEIEGTKLINCGFPVNFNREYQSVDGIEFQFTRSLIFAALVQALHSDEKKKGYLALDLDYQNLIVKKIKNSNETILSK